MILFCEDCGRKNDLDPLSLTGGRAVFKCTGCGYPNSYPVNVKEQVSLGDADRFFEKVKSHPEVIGAFIYHIEKGVVTAQMPAMLAREDINTLGQGLARSYASGGDNFSDIRSMTVVISDKYFSVHKVRASFYVIVVAKGPDLPEDILKYIIGMERDD